jgi:CubicO group peptidase (beta-lactamase class C family)
MFRTASISKSITAIAAMRLVEQGKLKLDERVFDILSDYQPCRGTITDKRINEVTVQHLMQCTAGWEGKHGDPLFGEELLNAATACGVSGPPDMKTVIRYWLEKPLIFAPGTRYGYSNFAYALLGEILARRSGQDYAQFVQTEVLHPMGMTRTLPGKTLTAYQGEVTYYPAPGDQECISLLEPGKTAPWSYGGDFIMELITAPAGWISTAPDLVRMCSALSGNRPESCLSPKAFEKMIGRPPFDKTGNKGYFGMGWEVYETAGGKMFSRIGGMPGTLSYVVYRPDGTCWCALFNSRSVNQSQLMAEMKELVWRSIKSCNQ